MKTKAKHPWEIRRIAHRNLTFWVMFVIVGGVVNVAAYRLGITSLLASIIGLEVVLGMTLVGLIRVSLRLLKAHWLEQIYRNESQPITNFAKKIARLEKRDEADFVFVDEFGTDNLPQFGISRE